MRYLCFHGFMGLGADWSPLVNQAQLKNSETRFYCPNIRLSEKGWRLEFATGFAQPISLEGRSELSGCETTLSGVAREILEALQPGRDFDFLLGYSQGGRLALHLLDQVLSDFGVQATQAFLISTHLGLFESSLVEERRKWEKAWKARFLDLSDQKLIEDWEGQGVFDGTAGSEKVLVHERRLEFGFQIEQWSPTRHHLSHDRDEIFEDSHFLLGSEDKKYVDYYREFSKKSPKLDFEILPRSGHRVHRDQPSAVVDWVFRKSSSAEPND